MSEQEQLSEAEVAAYLRRHPAFFYRHLDLLERMSIPHPSGQAVSLISKQLEIFRSKHQEQEDQLNTLIEIAKDNDAALNRMHELTLAMLEANTLTAVVSNLREVLAQCFLTDFVVVKIIRDTEHLPAGQLFVSPTDAGLKYFANELSSGKPKCGRPNIAQARFLFGDDADQVYSCAIIPMAFTQLDGLLAIGSRDENRFHEDMGHLFLTQMGRIVGTRLIALLQESLKNA